MASAPVRVYLLDNSYKAMMLDDKTTVGDCLQECCKKFDIDESHTKLFSLFEVTKRGQQILQMPKKLKPIIEGWKGEKNNRLLFKLSLFVSSIYENVDYCSPGEVRLLYLYAASLFINSYYPMTIEEVLTLGGLRMQVILGDHKNDLHSELFRKHPQKLLSFVPPTMQGSKKISDWEKMLFSAHSKNMGKSATSAEKEYFLHMKTRTYFGMKLYQVSVKSSKHHKLKGKFIAGVGSEGISIFKDGHTDKIIEQFEIAKMSNVTVSSSHFIFEYDTKNYTIDSKKASEIENVFQVYNELQMKLNKQMKVSRKASVFQRPDLGGMGSGFNSLPLSLDTDGFDVPLPDIPPLMDDIPDLNELDMPALPDEIPGEFPTDLPETLPGLGSPVPTLDQIKGGKTKKRVKKKMPADKVPPKPASPKVKKPILDETPKPPKTAKPEKKDEVKKEPEAEKEAIESVNKEEEKTVIVDEPIVYGKVIDARPIDENDVADVAEALRRVLDNSIDTKNVSISLDRFIKCRPPFKFLRERGYIPGPEAPVVYDAVRRLEWERLSRYLETFFLIQPDPWELVDLSIMIGCDVADSIQCLQVELYNKLLERPSRDDLVSKKILLDTEYESMEAPPKLKKHIPDGTVVERQIPKPEHPDVLPVPPKLSRMASTFDISKPPPSVPARPKPAADFDLSKPPPIVPRKPKPFAGAKVPALPDAPKPARPAVEKPKLPAVPAVPMTAKPSVPSPKPPIPAGKPQVPKKPAIKPEKEEDFFSEDEESDFEGEQPPLPESESPSDIPDVPVPKMPKQIIDFLDAIGMTNNSG